LAAIGEFERGLIRERSREGREKAKERGVRFGAKPKLSQENIQMLLEDFESPELSKVEIGKIYGISVSSVYRLYYENREQLEVA
jgi:DNA invertase Pin-like site-specific DNA recombinase